MMLQKLKLSLSVFIFAFTIVACGAPRVISFKKETFDFRTLTDYDVLQNEAQSAEQQWYISQIDSLLDKQMSARNLFFDAQSNYVFRYKVSRENVTRVSGGNDNFSRWNRNFFPTVHVNRSMEGILLLELVTRDGNVLWQGSRAIGRAPRKSDPRLAVIFAGEAILSDFPVPKR